MKRGNLNTETTVIQLCGWKKREDTGKTPREEGGWAWGTYKPRNAKDRGQTSRNEKRQGRIVLRFSRLPCRHLDLRLSAPRTVRRSSSALLSHPCAVLSYGSPGTQRIDGKSLKDFKPVGDTCYGYKRFLLWKEHIESQQEGGQPATHRDPGLRWCWQRLCS